MVLGTPNIKIKGVKSLKEVSYNIMPDRIEAGTFLMMGAATGGKILLKSAMPRHISPLISKLEETGCKIFIDNEKIALIAPKRLKSVSITTMPYPRLSNRYAIYIFKHVNCCKRNFNCYRKYI